MIIVDGNVYSGKNLTVRNNKVFVDGKEVTPDGKNIKIEVHGNVDSITADCVDYITVEGSVGSVKTTNGDVTCGDVGGSITTTNGDVDCKHVNGNVSTVNGDISK